MMSLLRRLQWWLRGSRKEAQLREELQFHLAKEAEERRAAGLRADEARSAAQRDLGNEARVREDVRAVWTWRPLDELSQDLRFAFRTMFKHRAVAVFSIMSLALGVGANTAIYSFIDTILLRSLPVGDPGSLVLMTWHSKPFNNRRSGAASEFVMRSTDGSTYRDSSGSVVARIFPYAAYERLQEVAAPTLASLFARFPAGKLTVLIDGEAELAGAEYVTGDFFGGIALSPSAGRLLHPDDDRAAAPPAVVLSAGYAQRRFGSIPSAVGRNILVNNLPFTVVGVTPQGFDGIDPGVTTSVYLPMETSRLLDRGAAARFLDANYYWAGIMGRLREGVTREQAEAALSTPFQQWVTATAATDAERANLPILRLDDGAGGLDTMRRKYSKPLWLLTAMVGLILAIACANTANLLLARATARQREIAVRLSIGAGRFRLIRQLLTESLVLSVISGALGILIAVAGIRLLTTLLAASGDGLRLDADLNWRVLAITIALSVLCGVLFGLAPAIQSTRPALVPALKETTRLPRYRLRQVLVVGQIALLMLLLTGAGLFVRTLSNLQSIPLGFNRDNLLLFELNAPQAGYPEASAATFYADLQRRLSEIPGVRAVTLSHASLIRAGRSHPVLVDGVSAEGTRFLQTGPRFFSTMQIPILRGREIDERDRAGSMPVVVISDQFASTFFPNQNPLGRQVHVGGSAGPLDLEIVGVAATTRYGPLKFTNPPVVYVPYSQLPVRQVRQMTYALRTDGDPLGHASTIRQIVHDADSRIPITSMTTQTAEIDQNINQEIVLARLCTAFAMLALIIACVGLYGTMSYGVARRTREIGIRVALGARRGGVVWMVMREALILTAVGLALSIPLMRGTSRFVESFLFDMKPNDPRAIAIALVTLITAALAASYGPARRAATVNPTTALRQD
jgi:macrolide transport system ATP-binding/permease protein